MNQYEAMFLFDPTFAASFDACESEVKRLMDRAEAELLFCRKWEERRLAHRIKGRKRGVYALVYFKAPPDKIKPLERDAQISENILRLLVVRADYATPEMMEMALRQREATATDDGGAPPSKSRAPDSTEEADKPDVAEPDATTRAAADAGATVDEAGTDSTEPVAGAGEVPETAREEID